VTSMSAASRLKQQVYHVEFAPTSTMAGAKRPDITLFTDSTPNGIKISMALEELGLPYKVEHLNISTNMQKEPAFLEVNPNGRIPAILDTFEDGEKIRIFESGSIFQYLVEQYDPDHKISYPAGSREHYEVNNWMFFQVSYLPASTTCAVRLRSFTSWDPSRPLTWPRMLAWAQCKDSRIISHAMLPRRSHTVIKPTVK
jgi:glutathione S-transferase